MSTAVNNNTAGNGNASGADAVAANGGAAQISQLFTKLLVAQIQYQNPLEPTDASQFVNQLSQLSQVESLQALTTQTAFNNSILSSLQMLSLGSQVGGTVHVSAAQLTLDGSPVELSFTLDNAAAPATLQLTDAAGRKREVDLGKLAPGSHGYKLDPKALGLAEGSYSIAVLNESKQSVTPEVVGRISGVRLASDGSALVQLGGLGEFNSRLITQFKGQVAAATTTH
ncbi:flagellar hook capping FlgD N-terminal domain-containing protein [Roseateles sp.]|uniref:flagellar hook capping FlgD N-terminal domain-containing protein n=1 Tax=Roseateles sp. TaxID=1971397 RepID=UPI0025DC98C5|nr:flagellar hook capping FlgD N-terminal domain-containing protein [Roseateles sp.]MBV8036766.1 flagellar basal body rod modification protein [Roseateles sp.]